MLTITPIRTPERASDHLARVHRYGGEEPPVTAWFGAGAAAKGLSGSVDGAQLETLLDGRIDERTRLGRHRDGERQHLHGWELMFSAPKSVSLAVLVGDDAQLVEAHDAALKEALGWLQQNAIVTRLHNGGKPRHYPTNCLLGAIVRHEISRAAEPHLHSRVLVVNATLAGPDRWRSIVSRPLYLAARTAGIRYQQTLANHAEEFGYGVVWNGNGTFALEGIPPALTALFSSRARAVETQLKACGLSRATANIAQRERATRQAKAARKRLPGEQQRQADRARTRQAGFDLEAFVARARQRTAHLPATSAALHTDGL